MIGIHFAGFDEGRPTIALAEALGLGEHSRDDPCERRFDRLRAIAPKTWRACNLNCADIVIYPHGDGDPKKTKPVERLARNAGLPCVFFRPNDDPTPTNLSYGTMYRTSIFEKRRTPRERAMPALTPDLLQGVNRAPRAKAPQPTIGFCGYVGDWVHRLSCRWTGRVEKHRGLELRHHAVSALGKSDDVDCHFIIRKQFWGGSVRRKHWDMEKQAKVRQEFVDNIFDTDYTLCARGKGNYSFRFYEVLSAGRIPLFINTDCALPFPGTIDYRKHCVWVEEKDLSRIAQIVRAFHDSLEPDQFAQLQQSNRELWQKWLSPEAFYKRIIDEAVSKDRPVAVALMDLRT